jgi:hypothetical protein
MIGLRPIPLPGAKGKLLFAHLVLNRDRRMS